MKWQNLPFKSPTQQLFPTQSLPSNNVFPEHQHTRAGRNQGESKFCNCTSLRKKSQSLPLWKWMVLNEKHQQLPYEHIKPFKLHICNSSTSNILSVYKNIPLGHQVIIIGILPASSSPQIQASYRLLVTTKSLKIVFLILKLHSGSSQKTDNIALYRNCSLLDNS